MFARYCLLFLLFPVFTVKSQLAGSYTVPGSFSSVAAAVQSLNLHGVAGPVTINIATGHIETVPIGGIVLQAVAGTSSTNVIWFRSLGTGQPPQLLAYSGGTATAASARQDGIWAMTGTDHVTIEGLELRDLNNSAGATMEYGIGLFKKDMYDGCQHVSIRNCTISLNSGFAVASTFTPVAGARGINMVNTTLYHQNTPLAVLSPSGSNSHNAFTANLIENVHSGIVMVGYEGSTPFAFNDTENQVGDGTTSGANRILNFGHISSPVEVNAVLAKAQHDLAIRCNEISNLSSASVPTVPVKAVVVSSASGSQLQVSSNTLMVRGNSTSGTLAIIETSGANTIDSIHISDNRFTGCSFLQNNTSPFFGIRQLADAGKLRIRNNGFSGNSLGSAGGSVILIASQGNVASQAVIASNTLGLSFQRPTAFTGTLQCISHSGGSQHASIVMSHNRFSGFYNVPATGNGEYNFIHNSSLYTSSLNIENNEFVNLTLNTSGNIYLIRNTGVVNHSLSASSNSVIGSFARVNGSTGQIYCMLLDGRSPGTCVQSVMNNRFSTMNINTGDGSFNGIVNWEGMADPYPQKHIMNNAITDINFPGGTFLSRIIDIKNAGDGVQNQGSTVISNTVSNITLNGPYKGIALTNTATTGAPLTVHSNIVHNLYAGFNSEITGLMIQANNHGLQVYRNKVTTVNTAGPYSTAMGLYVYGFTATVFNNIVGHINAAGNLGTPTYGSFVNGIMLLSHNNLQAYHNTVYLSGNNYSSNAAYIFHFGVTELTNNIFVNLSSGSVARAMRRGGPTLSNISRKTNNNLYYAGTPGPGNVIYSDGVNTCSTLAAYQNLAPGLEPNSVTENPPFASITPTSPAYLTLLTNVATQVESGAQYLPQVPLDFNNAARSFSTTDIGAFEGSLTGNTLNVLPPVIGNYSLTGSPCGTSSKTIHITLSDPSSLATGSLLPTLYYRVNGGSYTATTGSLSSGNTQAGTWSFTPAYNAAPGDVVSWFVVSQDQSGNVAVWPADGASVVSVNSIVATPTNPVTYTIGMSLSGVYNVGAGGTFTTLTQAANAYNTSCLTGPVTFSLTDALYSTAETYPITFAENPDASATNSLLVMPAAGNQVTISAVVSSGAVLKFYKASHITVDGINQANTGFSIITNTGVANTKLVWLSSENAEKKGNSNITLKNMFMQGSGSNYGIVTSNDNSPQISPCFNSSISVISNTVINVNYGIGCYGFSPQSGSANNNWKIENNVIGFPVTQSLIINQAGIFVANSRSVSIVSNTVQNVQSGYVTEAGISLLAVSHFTVDNNAISDVRMYNYINNGGPERASGLYVGRSTNNGVVSNNRIQNLRDYSNHGMVIGINVLTHSQNSSIRIFNNFIGDFKASGGPTVDTYLRAISIEGGSSDIDVDHNTIYLANSHAHYSGYDGSSCIYLDNLPQVPDGPGNLRIRNNILVNMQDNPNTTTDKTYCIYSKLPVSSISDISNNSFYSGGNQFRYAYFGTDLVSFNSFTAALPNGHNSINALPVTQSSVDFHLDPAALANYAIDGKAQAIPSISLDIDAGMRSPVTPDIGADEFVSTASCVAAFAPTLTATGFTICQNQSVNLTATTQPGGIGTTYQWKVSSVPGGPYSSITTGSALASANATALIGGPGIYYAVLESACNNTATSVSGEATVVISALPSPTVISSSTLTCEGGSVTFTATGAASYTWNNGSTGSVMTMPNNAIGNYFVLGETEGCAPAYSNSVSVSYGSFPFTVQANKVSVCKGDTAHLTASGAVNYTWSTASTASSVAVVPASTQVYTVFALHAGGCVNSNTIGITVMPLPTISIAGDPTVCAGLPLDLAAQGASGYFWINSAATTASVQVTPTANTIYSVIGTDANGCSSLAQKTVVVTNTLNINILGSNTVCANSAITHSVTGTYNYTWTTPTGTASASSVTTSPATDFVYQVSASTLACVGSATVFVDVFSPTLSVAGQFTACQGSAAALIATGAQNYTWQPAGLTGSVITYTAGATSFFTVSGNDIHGCITDYTFAATSLSLPVISVAAGTPSVCSGSAATFTATGASSYTWSNGGGSGISATYTPTPAQVFTVTGLEAGTGCSSQTTFSTIVHANPTIAISGNTPLCTGQSATLTAGGASTYTWNGTHVTSSLAIAPSSTSNYSVVARSVHGCQSQTVVNIVVNQLPALSITPSSPTVCAHSSSTLSVSGAVTYTWNTGVTGNSLPFSVPASTVYNVSGTSSAGCVGSQSVSVSVNALPSIVISPASASVCEQSPVSFTAQGAGFYTWSGNGGNNSSATYTPSSSQVYTVTGTDLNGCVNTGTVGIITYSLPVLLVSGDTSLCAGEATTLDISGAQSYTWSTGAFTSTVNLNPSSTSVYSVTGVSSQGCLSSGTATVFVHAIPVISITLSSATLCAGETLTATASGASTYSWSGLGTGAVLTATPGASGNFTVQGLSGTGCAGTQTAAVIVHTVPVMSIVPASQTVCAGIAVSFTASGAPSLTWTGTSGNGSTVTFTPSGSGAIGVTGSDPASGCTSSASAVVVVNDLPLVSVSGNSAVCVGGSVQLTASGAATYSWSYGPTGATALFAPSTSTVISVTGTATNGCTSTRNFTISVIAFPTLAVNGQQTICVGETALLNASGAATYSWSSGHLTHSIAVSPVTTTSYIVWGFAGPAACSSSLSVPVQVNPLPSVTASVTRDTICYGEKIVLSGSGAVSYQWSGGVTNATGFMPQSTNSYTVTGTDANGCKGVHVISNVVLPVPNITVTGRDTLCAGEELFLVAGGAVSYTWSTGQVGDTLIQIPQQPQVYVVTGLGANSCTSSVTVMIHIESCTGVERADEHRISVYPTVCSERFYIEGYQSAARYAVYDLAGKLITEGVIGQSLQEINVENVARGLYILRHGESGSLMREVKIALQQ